MFNCDAAPLADTALGWLLPRSGDQPFERVRRDLDEVRRRLGEPGAAGRAAEILLRDVAAEK